MRGVLEHPEHPPGYTPTLYHQSIIDRLAVTFENKTIELG